GSTTISRSISRNLKKALIPDKSLACDLAEPPSSETPARKSCNSLLLTSCKLTLPLAATNSCSLATSRKYASTELADSDRSSCRYCLKEFTAADHDIKSGK